MPNIAQENLANLKARHYLLLANKGQHWFNAYPGMVAEYRAKYGDDFCLVLWRTGKHNDAYVVPYSKLTSLFTKDTLVRGPKNTLRWHGQVKDGRLALLGRRGNAVRVDQFHNAFDLLRNAMPRALSHGKPVAPIAIPSTALDTQSHQKEIGTTMPNRSRRSRRRPEFVRFLRPLLDALKQLGGSGRPAEVVRALASIMDVSGEEQARPLTRGVQNALRTKCIGHDFTWRELDISIRRSTASGPLPTKRKR